MFYGKYGRFFFKTWQIDPSFGDFTINTNVRELQFDSREVQKRLMVHVGPSDWSTYCILTIPYRVLLSHLMCPLEYVFSKAFGRIGAHAYGQENIG